MITDRSKQEYRRAPIRRSQYLRLRKICHAWLAEQILSGGPEVEALILTHRADLEEAAGVWAWDLLEAAREAWHAEAVPLRFGAWLRAHEVELVTDAAKTFLTERCASIRKTEIVKVQ
jgi:hypothetical protein